MESRFRFRDLGGLLKESFKDWNDDDAFTHAAAVSYTAIFSLPGILIVLVNIAGVFFGKAAVEGKLTATIGQTIGPNSAAQIQTMVENAGMHAHSTIMMIIGSAILVISATSLFIQLKKALNRLWEVKTREDAGILAIIFDRTRTFGILLVVGFLLLVSMTITGLLTVFSNWITSRLPDFTIYVFHALNFAISFGIISLLFALIFKFLPDVRIPFKSVWPGAMVTAFLFMVGQYAMALYFSMANPASAYGVAGSLILILLWVYYSTLLLFFGAEFTQSYAMKYGHKIEPSKTAIKVEPCIPVEPKSYSTR